MGFLPRSLLKAKRAQICGVLHTRSCDKEAGAHKTLSYAMPKMTSDNIEP